jgi:glutamate-ammonia-ligase adenylyltransferase
VRSIHERLFFAPLLDTLAGAGPLSSEAAQERLAAFGFTDVERTRAAVRELAFGLTRRSKLMQQLLPVILEWLSETPDPDLGLLQLRRLAEGPARSASLATTFRDAPVAAERTCILLGSSRVVGDALRRNPEFVDLLVDNDALAEKPRAELVDDALETLEWRGSAEARREGLRRFKRRELLRIAARSARSCDAGGHRARAHGARRGLPRVALAGLEPPDRSR